MTLPLSPEELKNYNNVPTTPLTQKLGDTINDLLAGSAYQVANMAARNALSPEPNQVVRVESTGELFVWDASTPQWRVVPNSSTRPNFFKRVPTANLVVIYVDPTGDDVNGEGTQASPFATVARALQSIPNGFLESIYISVAGGTYSDQLWQAPAPGAVPPASAVPGASTFPPYIRVYGQGHLQSEVITLAAGNLTASTVPHPSGSGNYASFRQFNFPTWTTPIPGSFPTVWPVAQVGADPEYFLIRSFVSSTGVNLPTVVQPVMPGSDNTTGNMRLLTTGNLFSTGDYFLARYTDLPQFPNLTRITAAIYGSQRVLALYALSLGYISGSGYIMPNMQGVQFTGCYFRGGQSTTTFFTDVFGSSSIFVKAGTSSTTVRVIGVEDFSALSASYFKQLPLNIVGDRSSLDVIFSDSTAAALTKIQLGNGVYSDTNNGAGGSGNVSYAGYVDLVGGGIGISSINSSVLQYNNITFDGVSNPLVLARSSWARRAGSVLGTSTSNTIIGIMSSTGPGDVLNPSGVGISGWTVANTVAAGQEVKVGNNGVQTYASLPSTDFSLGNTSLGAVGR